MIIKKVEIERKTKFKIYNKHGIKFNEVEQALINLSRKPKTRNMWRSQKPAGI